MVKLKKVLFNTVTEEITMIGDIYINPNLVQYVEPNMEGICRVGLVDLESDIIVAGSAEEVVQKLGI